MKPNMKKLLILNAPYLLFVWLFMKVGEAFRLSPGADLSGKLLHIMEGVTPAFESPLPSLNGQDFLIGVAGAVILRIAVYMKGKNAKKYRKGVEYGSARWGNAKDIEPYIDPDFYNNVLLTQTERLTMNSRPKSPKYARNKNVLVIGGSGSGKTRFFVKPNLMQMHSSYCITDPKGTILIECGKLLDKGGYKIKVLNTINFKKSMHYNPFAYLHSEKDILKLVNTIMVNTKGEGEKSSEDFWTKAEKLYYTALIGYIYYEAPEEEKNFTTLLDMINASEAREDDEDFKNPVDLMFDRLEEKDPEHFAVKQYKKYKLAAGKTAKSILISCGARLAPFDIRELRELMETDDLELDTLGDRKTALFVIISDTDDTFNFIVAMMYTQLFNLLCDKADDVYGGRVEANREDNRLQIFFEEKPDEKTRETLKESGFRWSPKAGAWQRQLNDNAIYAADRLPCIRPLSGKSPVEIQKEARTTAKTEKKPSIRAQLAQDKEALKNAPKKAAQKEKSRT